MDTSALKYFVSVYFLTISYINGFPIHQNNESTTISSNSTSIPTQPPTSTLGQPLQPLNDSLEPLKFPEVFETTTQRRIIPRSVGKTRQWLRTRPNYTNVYSFGKYHDMVGNPMPWGAKRPLFMPITTQPNKNLFPSIPAFPPEKLPHIPDPPFLETMKNGVVDVLKKTPIVQRIFVNWTNGEELPTTWLEG